jgi:hypothetical protein
LQKKEDIDFESRKRKVFLMHRWDIIRQKVFYHLIIIFKYSIAPRA